jgi:hypothetical protein
MPNLLPLAPLFAAETDAVIAIIVALITIVGWIANLISNKNQKGPPVANRPRPPVRPRDDRLQQEINIFIEEAGAQRPRPAPSRPVIGASRPVAGGQRTPVSGKTRPPAPPAKKSARRPRPGDEIATRHAPVSETLGTGVKQHLSQHMTERVTQEVQQRLASRVDEKVEQDLGPAATAGLSARSTLPPSSAPPADRAARFAGLLRNPATVQQAIVASLILATPVARRRPGGGPSGESGR